MVSFQGFRIKEGSPIYVQIMQHVKQSIAAGTIKDGEEMPSRRVLSALLGINPNTVQKAYRLLEDESIIISSPGAVSYVSVSACKRREIRDELLRTYVGAVVDTLKAMGVTKGEAALLMDKMWE